MRNGRQRSGLVTIALLASITLVACAPPPKPGATPKAPPTSPPSSLPPAGTVDERLREALASGQQRFAAQELFRSNRLASFGFSDDTKSALCVTPTPTAPAD